MTFLSRPEYEKFLYGLLDSHPDVIGSTLHLYSTSALTAVVEGSLTLRNGLEIRVIEALDFKAGQIRRYSYTVFRDQERIRWYDSQPHPESPELAETFPRHLHEPPDIKHNRKPPRASASPSPTSPP